MCFLNYSLELYISTACSTFFDKYDKSIKEETERVFKKYSVICDKSYKNLLVNLAKSFKIQPKCVQTSSKGQLTLNKKKKQPFAVFFRIGVLKNFAIFTEKHLCWSLFLYKKTRLQSWNFIKKRLQHRCFPVNIANFFKAPVSNKICERLLERFST